VRSLCSTSDVIAFDQNWHHVLSSSAGGKDLSNDTQIRMIGSMESEICTKMFSMMFSREASGILGLEASPVKS